MRPSDQVQHGDEQQQLCDAGDDFRHHERRVDHADQQQPAAKARKAHQRNRRQRAEHHRAGGYDDAYFQRQPGRIENLIVVQKSRIPAGREPAPDADQCGGVEGVGDQHQDRHIQDRDPDTQDGEQHRRGAFVHRRQLRARAASYCSAGISRSAQPAGSGTRWPPPRRPASPGCRKIHPTVPALSSDCRVRRAG